MLPPWMHPAGLHMLDQAQKKWKSAIHFQRASWIELYHCKIRADWPEWFASQPNESFLYEWVHCCQNAPYQTRSHDHQRICEDTHRTQQNSLDMNKQIERMASCREPKLCFEMWKTMGIFLCIFKKEECPIRFIGSAEGICGSFHQGDNNVVRKQRHEVNDTRVKCYTHGSSMNQRESRPCIKYSHGRKNSEQIRKMEMRRWVTLIVFFFQASVVPNVFYH